MKQRKFGPFSSSAIGLGCMNLSHAYGVAPDEVVATRVLHEALDVGYTHFDSAALYGFGANEKLLGRALKNRRDDYILVSKCGIFKDADGVRSINGRPETIRKTCEASLINLQTDVIDIYYLHRLDKNVPVEDTVGALSDLVSEGKIRTIGISEVSADTLRKAHATHPITAVQTEYSLWTRNAEIAVLDACRELDIAFVPFSPVARGFLTGTLTDVDTLDENDIRRAMPRFYPENYPANLALLEGYAILAEEAGCSMAQLALAWLLAKGDNIIPIPGTTSIEHLRENAAATEVTLSVEIVEKLDGMFVGDAIKGPRYNEVVQAGIDTEEF